MNYARIHLFYNLPKKMSSLSLNEFTNKLQMLSALFGVLKRFLSHIGICVHNFLYEQMGDVN
jgi:hypothetical protein